PGLVTTPWPRRRPQAGTVRHHLANRHLSDVAERVVHGPELGHELDDWIVERQPAAIAQLHDPDPGEGFRDRRPMKDRLRIDRTLRAEILITIHRGRHDVAVADDENAAADDSGGLDLLMKDLFDDVPARQWRPSSPST